jgi:hypothetical protein
MRHLEVLHRPKIKFVRLPHVKNLAGELHKLHQMVKQVSYLNHILVVIMFVVKLLTLVRMLVQ